MPEVVTGKKIRTIMWPSGEVQLMFKCPGCGYVHTVNQSWQFNGDLDEPTFQPSVLVTTGHYCSHAKSTDCYCNFSERFPDEEPPPYKCSRCHSFVTNGHIQFLNDSTHELAGQTVDLPDWEEQ